MNNKGISIISLVVTIILIIILAAISTPILSSVIDDSFEEDAKVELKNVQNVVEYAKAQILVDQFIPNEEKYKISYDDLFMKFGEILTSEELEYIKHINEDDSIRAPYKYYLMDQKAFDDELRGKVNISGIRQNRQYLINYMTGLIIMNNGGIRVTNRPDNPIVPTPDLVRGEVNVTFYPDGNKEWARQQATNVTLAIGPGTTVYSAKYMWAEEFNEPDASEYTNEFTGIADGGGPYNFSQELTEETGNDWYLWVLVEYDDVDVRTTKAFRSDAFYIDNIPPSASFNVDEIVK